MFLWGLFAPQSLSPLLHHPQAHQVGHVAGALEVVAVEDDAVQRGIVSPSSTPPPQLRTVLAESPSSVTTKRSAGYPTWGLRTRVWRK